MDILPPDVIRLIASDPSCYLRISQLNSRYREITRPCLKQLSNLPITAREALRVLYEGSTLYFSKGKTSVSIEPDKIYITVTETVLGCYRGPAHYVRDQSKIYLKNIIKKYLEDQYDLSLITLHQIYLNRAGCQPYVKDLMWEIFKRRAPLISNVGWKLASLVNEYLSIERDPSPEIKYYIDLNKKQEELLALALQLPSDEN